MRSSRNSRLGGFSTCDFRYIQTGTYFSKVAKVALQKDSLPCSGASWTAPLSIKLLADPWLTVITRFLGKWCINPSKTGANALTANQKWRCPTNVPQLGTARRTRCCFLYGLASPAPRGRPFAGLWFVSVWQVEDLSRGRPVCLLERASP